MDVIYQMAGLPNREVAPLSRKEQERRERYAKKGQARRAAAGGKCDHACALSADHVSLDWRRSSGKSTPE